MQEDTDTLAKRLWDYNVLNQPLEKADAIIAMGSMDTRVAERAAELWHDGLAPVVVVAGGYGRLTAELASISEAEQFKQVLLEKSVPEDKILVEDKSTNSEENYRFVFALLKEHGGEPGSLIVITKTYMERRALATIRKIFPDINVTMASPQLSYETYPNKVISKELMINMLVGDTQRVKIYPDRGFTIPQEMPASVEAAMQELIRRGFDKQLVK